MKPDVLYCINSQGGIFYVLRGGWRHRRKIRRALWAHEDVAMVTRGLPEGTLLPEGCKDAFFVLGDVNRNPAEMRTDTFMRKVAESVASILRISLTLDEETVREIRLPEKR